MKSCYKDILPRYIAKQIVTEGRAGKFYFCFKCNGYHVTTFKGERPLKEFIQINNFRIIV